MIRPPGLRGGAFGEAADGDARRDPSARLTLSRALDIPTEWAFVSQVHGAGVTEARQPGNLGEADAMFTTAPALPMTVATADCVPIVVEGDDVAGVIHAGWRGLHAGVIPALLEAVAARGRVLRRAAVGPSIGPCCYEVGADVADLFPDHGATTSHGTRSVDLPGVAAAQLGELVVWAATVCTSCGDGWHSFRRDRTDLRQVAVAWLPTG